MAKKILRLKKKTVEEPVEIENPDTEPQEEPQAESQEEDFNEQLKKMMTIAVEPPVEEKPVVSTPTPLSPPVVLGRKPRNPVSSRGAKISSRVGL